MALRFKVYSSPHTRFAATHLVDQLRKLGHRAEYVTHINKFDTAVYIIYNANSCRILPPNYIVYQTEIHGTHHFNARYHRIIKGALAVWEYSSDNLHAYQHKRVFMVTPGISIQPETPKDIPFLFYGWIDGSPRRKVIHSIKNTIPVTIVTNKLCDDIWNLLKRTKTVINIHYHEHSPLELFRINEALSFGCDVISEGYSNRYADLVTFCKYGDLLKTVKEKQSENKKDLAKLDNLFEVQAAIDKHFYGRN